MTFRLASVFLSEVLWLRYTTVKCHQYYMSDDVQMTGTDLLRFLYVENQ